MGRPARLRGREGGLQLRSRRPGRWREAATAGQEHPAGVLGPAGGRGRRGRRHPHPRQLAVRGRVRAGPVVEGTGHRQGAARPREVQEDGDAASSARSSRWSRTAPVAVLEAVLLGAVAARGGVPAERQAAGPAPPVLRDGLPGAAQGRGREVGVLRDGRPDERRRRPDLLRHDLAALRGGRGGREPQQHQLLGKYEPLRKRGHSQERARRRAADRHRSGCDARWTTGALVGLLGRDGRRDDGREGQEGPARLAAGSLRLRRRRRHELGRQPPHAARWATASTSCARACAPATR